MKQQIKQLTDQIYPKITEIRRDIHMHPEIAFDEYRTAGLVADYLKNERIPYRGGIAKTGVVATIQGAAPGKTLLIRADMDALPITEQNNVTYRSVNSELMHACGHDAHTAILLGAASLLNQIKDRFSGTVKLIFQPAEEGVGGAMPMIREGILENPQVDACIALHVSPLCNAGEILIKSGEITASPDDFEIKIIGKSGHGAAPQEAIDPIAIGCQIVSALQLIPSRMVDANAPVVLSIGYFNAGTSPNIIPDYALIGGTVRTITADLRNKIPQVIKNIVEGIAHSMGAEYEFNYNFLFPPAVNDEALTRQAIRSFENAIGRENILPQENPFMIGEDFSYFGQHAPSVMFYLGCRNDKKNITHPLHSAQFDIDEACMKTGMELFCNFALDYLND